MGKRKFQLSETEIRQLSQHLDRSEDQHTHLRLQAVLWYGIGVPLKQIQMRLNCSRSSILSWCRVYNLTGTAGLTSKWQGGNNAHLTRAQMEDLNAKLQANTPQSLFKLKAPSRNGLQWTVEDLYRAIKMWYGVVYRSRSSYYRLLKKYLDHLKQLNQDRDQPSKV